MNRMLEATIRIGLVLLLVAWCLQIVRPFIIPLAWGVIIAVATYPGYRRLYGWCGRRHAIAATLYVLLGLVLFIVPTLLLSGSLASSAHGIVRGFEDGSLSVPPPPQWAVDVPLVGESLHATWSEASKNLEDALLGFAPQIRATLKWLFSAAAGAGVGVLMFVFAIIIAGLLLAHAESGERMAKAIATRLAGRRGADFADLAEQTVRSVSRGILGVALIQSLAAGIGFMVAGIPGAGLWALLALVGSTIQVGIFPVMIPSMLYVIATADGVTIALYLVYGGFVSMLDNILKPIMLGRGVKVPMLVVFVGAIGGLLSSGIIGLFVGSVVLVLGYKLFQAWLYEGEIPLASGVQPGKDDPSS